MEQEPPPVNILPWPTLQADPDDPDVRDALRGLIASILAQDEENERELRAQMGVLASTLQHIQHGAAAGRGYAAVLSAVRGVPSTNDYRA